MPPGRGICGGQLRLAGTPRTSPPIIAAIPTSRLVMNPLTKLFWSKMCPNQRSV
jgi:hypothetical protein